MRGFSLGVWCFITVLRILRAQEHSSRQHSEKNVEKRELYDYSFTNGGGGGGGGSGFNLGLPGGFIEDHRHEDNKEVHENVKTIIVTKKVPVPYAVHVEKRVPYPVKVTVRRPYTVYVPKPYLVEIPKPVPYTLKVPVPQPYTVEKHVPVPYKVTVDKPVPVQVPKPYPIYVEKKVPYTVEKHVPYQVKVPVDKPYPVPVPVEKPVPYPVEKPVPVPVKVPIDRPVPVPIERPFPVHVENPVPYPVEKLVPYPVHIPVTNNHQEIGVFNYDQLKHQEAGTTSVAAPVVNYKETTSSNFNHDTPSSYVQEVTPNHHHETASNLNHQSPSDFKHEANNFNSESANNFHHEALIQPPPIQHQSHETILHMQPPPLITNVNTGNNFSPSPKDPSQTSEFHSFRESDSHGSNIGQSNYYHENHPVQPGSVPVNNIGSSINPQQHNHGQVRDSLHSLHLGNSGHSSYVPTSISEPSINFQENHSGHPSNIPVSGSGHYNNFHEGSVGQRIHTIGINGAPQSLNFPNNGQYANLVNVNVPPHPPRVHLPRLYEPVFNHKYPLSGHKPGPSTSEFHIQQSFQNSNHHLQAQPLFQVHQPHQHQQQQTHTNVQPDVQEQEQQHNQQKHQDDIGIIQEDQHQYSEPLESANTHVSQSYFQQLEPTNEQNPKMKIGQEQIIGIKPPNKPKYSRFHHQGYKYPHTTQLYVVHQKSENHETLRNKGQTGVLQSTTIDPPTAYPSTEHEANRNPLGQTSNSQTVKTVQSSTNKQNTPILQIQNIPTRQDDRNNFQPMLNYNQETMSEFIQQQEHRDIKKLNRLEEQFTARDFGRQEKVPQGNEEQDADIIFGTMKTFDETDAVPPTDTPTEEPSRTQDADQTAPFLPTPMMLIQVPPKELQGHRITYIPEGNYSLQTTKVYPTQATSGGQVFTLVATPQTAMQLMRYTQAIPSDVPPQDTTTPLRPDQMTYPTQISTTDPGVELQTYYNQETRPTVQMFIPNESPTQYYPVEPQVVSAAMKVRIPYAQTEDPRDTTEVAPTAETIAQDKDSEEGQTEIREDAPPTRTTVKHRTKNGKTKGRHSQRVKFQTQEDEQTKGGQARTVYSGKTIRSKTKKRAPRPTKPTPPEEQTLPEKPELTVEEPQLTQQPLLSENPIVVPDRPELTAEASEEPQQVSRVQVTQYETEDDKGNVQVLQSKAQVYHPPTSNERMTATATSYSEMRRSFGKRTRRITKNNNLKNNSSNSNSNNES